MSSFTFWFTFLASAAVCLADLSQQYDQGPVRLGSHANISWSVDNDAKTISMGVEFRDAELRTAGISWVGIGVGEDNSGGMLGADIFSAVFSANVTNTCTVKNRHVPFVAYPIRNAFPEEDLCQSEKSWALVSCTRDPKTGTATLEVKRPLAAFSIQDRAIGAGPQNIMYAFGGRSFSYHNDKRTSRRIVLFNPDGSYPRNQVVPLPDDIDRTFEITATNYSVPNGTEYSCTTAKLDLQPNETLFFAGAEPILKEVSGSNKAHHFLVYFCEDNEFTRNFASTRECGQAPNDMRLKCTGMVYAWAVGGGRFLLPDNVGFKVGNHNNMVLIETHFDNPSNDVDAIDRSGARTFFSKERPVEAGVMVLGDSTVSMFGKQVASNYNYTSTCPSNCTATWKDEEITVVHSLLHMHTTGKQIWSNRYDSDGKFIETMNAVRFWSNDFQPGTEFNKPKKIKRGDILSTTCIYDTSKAPDTKFGLETRDEMCVDFLWYYPVQMRSENEGSWFSCGMMHNSSTNCNSTVCGAPFLPKNHNPEANPSFNDSVGLTVDFSVEPAGCTLQLAGQRADTAVHNSKKNGTRADCFPADAQVRTRTGLVRMESLEVGDEVEVGAGCYSRVYMFTHKLPAAHSTFVVLVTSAGKLALSGGHLLYVKGKLIRADAVRVGDDLMAKDKKPLPVISVEYRNTRGLYNPQTEHGDIVVDGVLTSTYTHAIQHNAAHALLSPLRTASCIGGVSSTLLENDTANVVRVIRSVLSS